MRIAYIGGAGRLGLAFALWSAECGHEVIISDINEAALERLRSGEVSDLEPGLVELAAAHKDDLILTTDNAQAARQADLVCIVVDTPSTSTGAFSSKHVLAAARQIAHGLSDGYKVISVVSTVMPGEVRKVGHLIENVSSLRLGADFGLVHCPEFIRQGSIVRDFSAPDFIVIGEYDQQSGDIAEQYFDSVICNASMIHRMSLESAELAKIGLNAVVVSKMALANELAWLCQAVPGADARDVLEVIGADSRVGRSYFGPGTWPGGPCFPRDTKALATAGRLAGMGTFVIAEVGRAADRELHRLNDLCRRLAVDYPRVGILGLTYKPGVNLSEESQGLALYATLAHLGKVDTHDPELAPSDLALFMDEHDLLVLMTCWSDYRRLYGMDLSGKCIVDMWGYLDGIECDRYIRFGKGPECTI